MNANKAVIFELLVIVLTWRETPAVTFFLYWRMDQYMDMDPECILGPCDVAMRAASISVHAPWLRHNNCLQ